MADYMSEFENMLSFGPVPAAKPEAKPPEPEPAAPAPEPAPADAPEPVRQDGPGQAPESHTGGEVRPSVSQDVSDAGRGPVSETLVLPQEDRDGRDADPEPDSGPADGFAVKPRLSGSPEAMSRMSRVELPKPMVAAIRGAFPGAENRNEAVAAYIYTMMGREGPVPERIKALSAEYPEDDRVVDLQARIKSLSEDLKASNDFTARQLRALQASLDQVLTLLVWIVGERAGCKMDLSATADRLDFLYPDHETVRARSARQSKEYAEQTAHRDGLETARRADRARDARVKSGKPRYGS